MSLEDDIRQLGRIPIFAQLDADARRLLAFSAENRILRAGDVLFRRGDLSDGGYFVLSGSVALDFSNETARSVQIARPHCLIGELALIVETERPATALAREPSGVLKISRTLFSRVLKEYPECAERIRRSILQGLLRFVSDLDRLKEPSSDLQFNQRPP